MYSEADRIPVKPACAKCGHSQRDHWQGKKHCIHPDCRYEEQWKKFQEKHHYREF